jgi:exopolysaccharide biosynthesis protein
MYMAQPHQGAIKSENTGFDRQLQLKRRRMQRIAIALIAVLVFSWLYIIAVFSDIPFIKKWRDIYIETAMDTYSHKWLATFFIPGFVIDEVMDKKEAFIRSQKSLETSWYQYSELPYLIFKDAYTYVNAGAGGTSDPATVFYKRFPFVNPASLEMYLADRPELLADGYDRLLINEAFTKDRSTLPVTVHGDPILVLDSENGIVIAEVTGDGYVGRLALVTNPAQVRVGISKYLGKVGQTVEQIARDNDAVLAINASGFADPEWHGNGGIVVGLLIKDGKILSQPVNNGYLNIGFSQDDRLYIGASVEEVKYRDAVEFMPALIINGKNVTDGFTGFGIQPRSAIGQAADGTVMLLTVDGRQIGYSLGCTVGNCAEILAKYGALQASNLDGGSSTIMVYRGKVINRPSSTTNAGRLVPDAFIVDYAKNVKK